MQIFSDMKPIAKSGEIILYVSEDGRMGMLYDSIRDTSGEKQPLQSCFKWGNFVELTPEEREALTQ